MVMLGVGLSELKASYFRAVSGHNVNNTGYCTDCIVFDKKYERKKALQLVNSLVF